MKKNILIIGASSDIGCELVKILDKNQFNLTATYNKNKKFKKKKNFYELDLSNDESVSRFLDNQKKKKIKFDNIISLNGKIYSKNLEQLSYQEIYQNFNDNTIGTIKFFKKIKSYLKNNSLTIYLSSISALAGSYDPIYSATKASGIGFFRSLSKWWTPQHKFLIICPGPVKGTKSFNKFSKKRKNHHLKTNPIKDIIDKKDLAKVLNDLLKPHWSYANGSIIHINGGIF